MSAAKTVAPQFEDCPYCGGKNFCEASCEHGEAQVAREGHIFLSAPLIHVICLECGSVIHSRVKNVDALLTREEKRSKL